MSSSYQALSSADRERRAEVLGEQPSSADLAAKVVKPTGPLTNPFGDNSPNSNDPMPKKDGAANPPLKDGSANAPKKPHKG